MAKPVKLKARGPRGFGDREAAEIRGVEAMLAKIKGVYELYGFEPVETPLIEYTDALGKFLPDQDRPNEGVFSFKDDDEQWLSLRYDLTAPLARYVAENFEALPKPYRSYRAGWVFRNEKPGPGRFRQFMQFDADTVGAPSVAADAEICMMAADTLEALGIPRGQYVIKVNNRKVLDGVMEAVGLAGDENSGKRLTVLRAIDKLDRLGWLGVSELLGPGRKDESGDFTRGAGLGEAQVNALETFIIGAKLPATQIGQENAYIETELDADNVQYGTAPFQYWHRNLENISRIDSLFKNTRYQEGIQELRDIAYLISASGYGTRRISIDPSVVRGLEYYTGPVFEAELLFEVNDEKGQPIRFGSVGGGGRYDGLVGRFRSEPVPATGFSIGVSRLASALKALGRLEGASVLGPVVVLVMDKDRMADYQRMVASLRAEKIPAELYLGGSGMKAQMKYADKRGAPCVIIQGSDEAARGIVQIKDLIEGAKAADAIASHQEWKEARPAQFECPVEDIVAKVKEVLARHG